MTRSSPFPNQANAAPLSKAIGVIGSQVATARLLGVTQGAVSKWVRRGMRVPAEHVPVIEAETLKLGALVSRYELRPDIFGPAPDATPAADGIDNRFEAAR